MKRILILLLLIISTDLFSLSEYSDAELIDKIIALVDTSLSRLKKIGKIGNEVIRGQKSGTMEYDTKLAGFNKGLNLIKYINYQDDIFIISGTIENNTNWSGSGNSTADFQISGPENFSLRFEMKLKDKVR
ncbi:MAG: hypothetical protein PF518_15595, partial [Spirochaetaceae bacterium]|nr:hypothetical protein [Spirochaetaceae bacterium]